MFVYKQGYTTRVKRRPVKEALSNWIYQHIVNHHKSDI